MTTALAFAWLSVGTGAAQTPPPAKAPSAGVTAYMPEPETLRQWEAEIKGTIDRSVLASGSLIERVSWLTSRATNEFLNVLGMNEIQPNGAAGSYLREPIVPVVSLAPLRDTAPPQSESGSTVTTSVPATSAPLPIPDMPAPAATSAPFSVSGIGEGFVNDTPHKQPDGMLFVPKAAQRLYGLRTSLAQVTQTPVTAKFDGIVIPDPSRGGHVQAAYLGRVEPLDTGMPYLGMRVTRGQPLVYLRSSLPPSERAHLRNEIARLTGDIIMSEKKIERLGVFFFVPFREGKVIYERLQLESLRKQREALLGMLTELEPIRASANGVISAVNVSVGQIVEVRQTMFEIVDPDGLWIEAVAYDPASVRNITAAAAITTDGVVVPLSFVGSGLELKQQAVPLHFRIEAQVANLLAGKPVSVIIQTGDVQPGIILPNESVVRTANGLDIVWEKVGPEQFTPRPVSTRALDATQLYVTGGLDTDTIIVTSSARLLSQFR